MNGELKIVSLDVQNVKRIKAVHIEPNGSVVILNGNNGHGKSSVLDAIMMALAGGKSIPGVPLRQGEKKGSARLDLGDVVVTRTFTESGGGTLKVEAKVGGAVTSIQSPQAWLDAKIGSLSFNPLEFLNLKGQKQADMLRDLVGIDTSDLDTRRADLYESRTEQNREAKAARITAESMPFYADAPEVEISMEQVRANCQHEQDKIDSKAAEAAALRDQIREADNADAEFARWTEASRAELNTLKAEDANAQTALHEATEALKAAELALAVAREKSSAASKRFDERLDALKVESQGKKDALEAERKRLEERRIAVDALPDGDTAGIVAAIEKASEINRRVKANMYRADAMNRADQLAEGANALTAQIDAIDREREAMIAAAKFPVAGLGIDPSGVVTFNGVPLDQASQAEKIRVSMAVALALNPALRLVLIRDASLLDPESMELVVEMAKDAGAQVWLERVGTGDVGAVIIEDGSIKENE